MLRRMVLNCGLVASSLAAFDRCRAFRVSPAAQASRLDVAQSGSEAPGFRFRPIEKRLHRAQATAADGAFRCELLIFLLDK